MKHSFKTLLTLALALVAGNAWGEEITLTATSGFGSSYGTTAPVGYSGDGIMYNPKNTPSGWASKQVIQFRKSGSGAGTLYNTEAINGISSISVYLVNVDKPFTLYYGSSSNPTTNETVNSSAVKTTESVSYTTTSSTTVSTDALIYTFDLSSSSPSYFKIVNGGNANYVYKIVITYGTSTSTPYINASNLTIEADATSGEIAYTIANPVSGKSVTASTTAEWISNIQVTDEKVTFSATANTGAERQGAITLKYDGASDKDVTVTQKKAIPTYASLEALVAASGEDWPTTTGETVKVTFTDKVITKLYTSGSYTNGIGLMAGDKEIEIYCKDVPSEWVVGGTVSATLTCPWKKYNTTWELCPTSWESISYTAPADAYDVNIDALTNGTITANPASALAGATITLTITPATHYMLKAGTLCVLNETTADEVEVADNKFTMPASDVLVSAEFEAMPHHTVLYSSLGEEAGSEDVYEGETIASAPTVTAPAGWTFTGWTTEDDYEQSTTAPTFFSASTPVTEDVILYAVYSKLESGSTIAYNKVIANQSDWRGDYLIAYSRTVFMDGSLAGGKEGVGTAQSHVSPGSACSDDEMTVTAEWGDEHYVTIEAIDDTDLSKGYVIKSHSLVSPYFYQTTNSNGMAGTDNKATAAKYPISIVFNSEADIDIALGGAAAGAILHYNKTVGSTGEMFRFYKDGGQQPIYLYKKTSGTAVYSLAPKSSYDATITSAGFATLYLDFAAAIPTGVTAYTAVAAEDAVTLTEIEDVIPAETAVVLEGAAGTYTFEEATTTAAAPANDLVGTLTATDWATVNNGQYIYVLGQKDGVVGFYKLSETGTIKANSAYLTLDEDPASGSIIIRKGDATAISLVQENGGEAVIYDLLGRHVSEPMRGIYIVNGKKMFIK